MAAARLVLQFLESRNVAAMRVVCHLVDQESSICCDRYRSQVKREDEEQGVKAEWHHGCTDDCRSNTRMSSAVHDPDLLHAALRELE